MSILQPSTTKSLKQFHQWSTYLYNATIFYCISYIIYIGFLVSALGILTLLYLIDLVFYTLIIIRLYQVKMQLADFPNKVNAETVEVLITQLRSFWILQALLLAYTIIGKGFLYRIIHNYFY